MPFKKADTLLKICKDVFGILPPGFGKIFPRVMKKVIVGTALVFIIKPRRIVVTVVI